MAASPRTQRAVQVIVYDLGNDQFMVGIREKWWKGREVLMRHLARARPLRRPDPCPPGVTHEVWFAYLALRQVVSDQVRVHRDGGTY